MNSLYSPEHLTQKQHSFCDPGFGSHKEQRVRKMVLALYQLHVHRHTYTLFSYSCDPISFYYLLKMPTNTHTGFHDARHCLIPMWDLHSQLFLLHILQTWISLPHYLGPLWTARGIFLHYTRMHIQVSQNACLHIIIFTSMGCANI